MIISIKDAVKFFGITVVCFCAVFVCTFFMNYYLDILPMKNLVQSEILPLYNAQLATAKMTCAITGGVLALIALIMLIFYIKIYIDRHSKEIGTLKAIGYSNLSISKNFLIFGFSAFIGCALGFGCAWISMSTIYKQLTIDGLPEIAITFHWPLLLFLVILPSILFSIFSLCYGYIALKRPALELIKGKQSKIKSENKNKKDKDLPFLKEMCFKSLSSKKMLVFFVAFASFCFSCMVQMGLSMEDLVSGTMGMMILVIGLVLATTSMLMAMTSLLRANSKNIAMMKATGYNLKDCFISIFAGYIPFALLGFGVGTVYQYGLLSIMINLVFKDVGDVPTYTFNIPMFFVTLALFVVFFLIVLAFYLFKVKRISLKEIMLED